MEKGDKPKPIKKRVIKEKQKQKQTQKQSVVVNINQPVKKPVKKRIYKKRIITQVQQNPIKNISSYQIPVERAEVYRNLTPAPQIPAKVQATVPATVPATVQEQELKNKSELIYKPEQELKNKSELIYESPMISNKDILYNEPKLDLIKNKYKKTKPLEEYMHPTEENPNFYINDAYDEEKVAEQIEEVEIGSPAGNKEEPVFITDNLFNEAKEAEKIDELGGTGGEQSEEEIKKQYYINKFKELREREKQDAIDRERMIKENTERAIIREAEEKKSWADFTKRREEERAMLATGLYRLENGKWVLKEPTLQPIQQEGGGLIPIQQEGGGLIPVQQTGGIVLPTQQEAPEEENAPEVMVSPSDEISAKQRIIDIRNEYIDLLRANSRNEEADKEELSLSKWTKKTKEHKHPDLIIKGYAKKISIIKK